jgi:hypothetical protein
MDDYLGKSLMIKSLFPGSPADPVGPIVFKGMYFIDSSVSSKHTVPPSDRESFLPHKLVPEKAERGQGAYWPRPSPPWTNTVQKS